MLAASIAYVKSMTRPSAPQQLYALLRTLIVSGLPPSRFESQSKQRSGLMWRRMRPLTVEPNVFPDPSLGTERKDRQRQLFNWMGAVNSLTDPDQVPTPNQSAWPRLRASQYESHHSGDWMQAGSAAPIPVPVHIRMPRLKSVEVLDTPAN